MIQKVILAGTQGSCAGVRMAIEALERLLERCGPPVYCYHQVVHNRIVVERFEAQGVVFVDNVEDVPPSAPLLLSAHGSGPDVMEKARTRHGLVVDAVCPMVAKVHHELRTRAARGYRIVYVGHAGHDEVVGSLAHAPNVDLVERTEDVESLPIDGEPVAVLAQTTLAEHEWKGVVHAAERRFGHVWTAPRSDICFATTNRQRSIAELATVTDAVVVVGSPNSSNTAALVAAAARAGSPRVLRVEGPDELPADLHGVVGVSSGASTPDDQLAAVVAALSPSGEFEVLPAIEEETVFPLPRELRDPRR
jgi:4-hydroxy-3-methylbut-2-enyl diphosphate reductase